jgi:hypothetical protein
MKSRLFIGPLFVFVAKRLRGSPYADCNIEWKDFRRVSLKASPLALGPSQNASITLKAVRSACSHRGLDRPAKICGQPSDHGTTLPFIKSAKLLDLTMPDMLIVSSNEAIE